MTVQRHLRAARFAAVILAGGLTLSSAVVVPVHAQSVEDELAKHQDAARRAEANQDFASAVKDYEWIVRQMPQSAEAKSNLAVALYFDNQPDRAAAVSRSAIAQNPNLYAAHLFLGLALAQLSQPAKAIVELERSVSMNPADSLAHTWLGYEYLALAQYDRAINQLEAAVQQKPQDVDIWYSLGQSYLESCKVATKALVKSYPDGGRTWQLAAQQAESQENPGRALHLYQEAEKRRPDIEELSAKIHSLGGSVSSQSSAPPAIANEDHLYQQTQLCETNAQNAFAHIHQIDPDSYRAHEVVADGALAASRYDDAIREYGLVLQRKAVVAGVHASLCDALVRVAKLHEAMQECEAEISASPHDPESYVGAARVALLLEDYSRADGFLKTALNLHPLPIAAFKFLGEVDFHDKQYTQAVIAFRKYLAVEARDASVYILLARCYKATGDKAKMDEAIATYKRLSDQARGNHDAQSALDGDKNDLPPATDREGE